MIFFLTHTLLVLVDIGAAAAAAVDARHLIYHHPRKQRM